MDTVWTDTTRTIAGSRVHVTRGGDGPPLLVLHHDIGTPDRLPLYDRLARHCTVLVPHHPGWGRSERPQWLRSVHDIAAIYQWLLAELDIDGCSLLGLGFGGWIAAEMAVAAPRQLHRLILVGAAGVKPPHSEILDQAVISYLAYPQAGFHDPQAFHRIYGEVSTDQLEQWDIAREMCFRVAWKPYMYNPSLPHLLGGVRTPVLVVWGDGDRHIPISAGETYAAALPQARLHVVSDCGHFVDMEKPDQLAELVEAFLAAD